MQYVRSCAFPTPWAEFRLHGFVAPDDGREHLALTLMPRFTPTPGMWRRAPTGSIRSGWETALTLAALVRSVDAPVNVAAGPGMPDLAELVRLGVARVSTATRFATLALAAVDRAAAALLESGRFDGLAATFTYADAQRLFEPA